MLIATFVRCLSELSQKYISFKDQCCHSDHGRTWRNQHDKDKWLKDYRLCKVHKFSYQTFALPKEEGSINIADRRMAQEGYRD
jgi:hypothetical protein